MNKMLVTKFNGIFGKDGDVEVFFAPGRVNLIGEHIDYNGGHVFPCALTIGTYAAVRKNNDKTLRLCSLNFEETGVITADLDDLVNRSEDEWANYPKGVFWTLKEKGYKMDFGMDILYFGNMPERSGLSSSASIEVLTGFIANEFYGLDLGLDDIALIGQYAENNFIGVKCGIMDQFAIALGKKDNAIFLDTDTLKYEYAPLQLKNKKLIIACSNKKRGLGDSKYNERRQECERALLELQKIMDITSLCELNREEFEESKAIIKEENCLRRARHAVYENDRTLQAVNALKENNIELFGQLMNESHISLRDDYEVTGIELDTLVEAAWEQKGVLGSRMTGAGFGGCTVSIVESESVNDFIENVGRIYEEKIGYRADFYPVEIGQGPHRK